MQFQTVLIFHCILSFGDGIIVLVPLISDNINFQVYFEFGDYFVSSIKNISIRKSYGRF